MKTTTTNFFKFAFMAVSAIALSMGATSCSDDDDPVKSSEKKILEFSIGDIKADIDDSEKTITLTLPAGTDITKQKPLIKVSDKASVDPLSGVETDFTNPVTYTVRAEDGTTQTYTATVNARKYLYLITKVTISKNNQNIEYVAFDYDEKNRLKHYEYAYTYEYASTQSCDFEYNDKGELIKFIVTFDTEEKKEYSLNYKDATTIEASYTEDGVARKDVFKLNDKGLLQRHYEDVDNQNTWVEFEYDSKGNVVKETSDDGEYSVFTYDDKNGMLKDITLPQWVMFYTIDVIKTPNNFISLTQYDNDGTTLDGTLTYTYTYDDNEYPVSYIYDYGETFNNKIEYKIIEE